MPACQPCSAGPPVAAGCRAARRSSSVGSGWAGPGGAAPTGCRRSSRGRRGRGGRGSCARAVVARVAAGPRVAAGVGPLAGPDDAGRDGRGRTAPAAGDGSAAASEGRSATTVAGSVGVGRSVLGASERGVASGVRAGLRRGVVGGRRPGVGRGVAGWSSSAPGASSTSPSAWIRSDQTPSGSRTWTGHGPPDGLRQLGDAGGDRGPRLGEVRHPHPLDDAVDRDLAGAVLAHLGADVGQSGRRRRRVLPVGLTRRSWCSLPLAPGRPPPKLRRAGPACIVEPQASAVRMVPRGRPSAAEQGVTGRRVRSGTSGQPGRVDAPGAHSSVRTSNQTVLPSGWTCVPQSDESASTSASPRPLGAVGSGCPTVGVPPPVSRTPTRTTSPSIRTCTAHRARVGTVHDRVGHQLAREQLDHLVRRPADPGTGDGLHHPVPRGPGGGALGVDDELVVDDVRVTTTRTLRTPEVSHIAHPPSLPDLVRSCPGGPPTRPGERDVGQASCTRPTRLPSESRTNACHSSVPAGPSVSSSWRKITCGSDSTTTPWPRSRSTVAATSSTRR